MALVSRFKKSDVNSKFNLKYAQLFVNFMIKRFLRIAPSLWVALCIAMIYGKYSGDSSAMKYMFSECASNFWTNLVFCANFYGSCLGGFWSVSVEMQLYVLSAIPIYFYLIKPYYGWVMVTVWIAMVVIARFAAVVYLSTLDYDNSTLGDLLIYAKYIYRNTFLRSDAYAIGMATFMFWEWLKTSGNCDISPLGATTSLTLTIMLITSTIFIITPFFLRSSTPEFWLTLTDGGTNESNLIVNYFYYSCLTDILVAFDTAGIILMVITTGKRHQQERDSSSLLESISITTIIDRLSYLLKYCYCTFTWVLGRFLSSSLIYPIASLSYTGYLLSLILSSSLIL